MNLALDFAAAMTAIASVVLLLAVSRELALDLQNSRATWAAFVGDATFALAAICGVVTGLAVLFGWGGA